MRTTKHILCTDWLHGQCNGLFSWTIVEKKRIDFKLWMKSMNSWLCRFETFESKSRKFGDDSSRTLSTQKKSPRFTTRAGVRDNNRSSIFYWNNLKNCFIRSSRKASTTESSVASSADSNPEIPSKPELSPERSTSENS